MVSVCAPVADSSATRSPGLAPRFCISGNSTGAMAAMSAILEPEMPDTRYMAPISTYDSPPRTWPSRLARNWIMARAMPVISMSDPRKMNSGTASSIKWDMPSSSRPTITTMGVLVARIRYENVASANENAIGTPAKTVAATTPTKKISRFSLPSDVNSGCASQNNPTTAAAPTSATSIWGRVCVRTRRSRATTDISPMPTGMAAARQALLSSSAGVMMKCSSCAYSTAGARISARKASDAAVAAVSSCARRAGLMLLTSAVMRMCSPRRKATTAPSMDSHRNRMEASSSDQTSGLWNA
ncbi:hypothetical protein FQZ97_680600 [compost metagenome]